MPGAVALSKTKQNLKETSKYVLIEKLSFTTSVSSGSVGQAKTTCEVIGGLQPTTGAVLQHQTSNYERDHQWAHEHIFPFRKKNPKHFPLYEIY